MGAQRLGWCVMLADVIDTRDDDDADVFHVFKSLVLFDVADTFEQTGPVEIEDVALARIAPLRTRRIVTVAPERRPDGGSVIVRIG